MICPICNALSPLEIFCPNCGSAAEDEGRSSDWSGPYSPYEPELVSFEEPSTAERTTCRHIVRCVGCQYTFPVEIAAWHI